MLATQSLPHPAHAHPRVYSALDLCKAMLAGTARGGGPDTSGLDRTLRHDPERGLIEVQAGIAWRALAAQTGLEFLPGTVGDSVAANAAGPDGRPMVAHLSSLTLVTADGELRRTSRERAPELFRLAVGGFGAYGPFYSVTLDLGSLAQSASSAIAPVCMELPAADLPGAPFRIEVLLPPTESQAFVGQARAALEERRCALTRLDVRPTQPEGETFLCWARRDFAAIRIEYRARATLGACASATQLRRRLIDLALGAGGAFTPAHLPHASREQAAACYPMLGAFLAEKRRYDPDERLLDPWYRGVRSLWRREACAVRWSRG